MEIKTKQVGGVGFYQLTNKVGFSITLSEMGASIYMMELDSHPLCIAEASPEDFIKSHNYFGRTVGRVAGRVKDSHIKVDDLDIHLPSNEGSNTLHGGPKNFSFRIFKSEIIETEEGKAVLFSLLSPDMDNNFPGELLLQVKYIVSEEEPKVKIVYQYSSSKDSVVSLTNHTFYNLGGYPTILDHELELRASKVMTYRNDLIPLGYTDITKVYDFSSFKKLGKDINDPVLYETKTKGYDHSYYVGEDTSTPVARLKSPIVGLDIYSDFPSIQIYTDNYNDERTLTNLGPGKPNLSVALEPSLVNGDFDPMKVKANQIYQHFISLEFYKVGD